MPSPAMPRALPGTASAPSPPLVTGPVGRLELAELARRILKALNEPKRLAILYALAGQPATVGELSRLIGASRSNTSQHLAVLRAQGLVDAKRHSYNVVYSLGHPKVIAAIELLRQVMLEENSRRASLRSELDAGSYPTGIKITNKQLASVAITPQAFHGEWNYTITGHRPADPSRNTIM